jgi:exonuclease III
LNVRSLVLHHNEIVELIRNKQPKILLLSETRVTVEIEDVELNIDGYVCVRGNSSSRYTGGVVIYLKSDITYEIVSNIGTIEHDYFLCIKIMKGFVNGHFAIIYHSPSANVMNFLTKLQEWCEEIIDFQKLNVIVGDFNVDVSKVSYNCSKLLDILKFYGLKQYVNDYTRVDGQHKTIIDLVASNDTTLKVRVSNYDNISDHNSIYIDCKNKDNEKTKVITSWKNYTKERLCEKLRNATDWDIVMNYYELEDKTTAYYTFLKESVDSLVETRTVTMRNGLENFSPELLDMKNKKIRSYDVAAQTGDASDIRKYNDLRNKYCKLLNNTTDKNVYTQLLDAGTDPKEIWKVLKKIVKNKNVNINAIKFENQLITNKQSIANKFNDYFIDSVQEINQSIENVRDYDLLIHNTPSRFQFKKTTVNEVWKILNTIKTKTGTDNINVKVVKDSFEVIGGILTNIINESIEKGIMPSEFKVSTVVPIQKIAKTVECSEFRPINMLPVPEKILEIIIKNQLSNYIENNRILIKQQSGFRRNHSCETSLNIVLKRWKEDIDKNKVIVAVFLDLKRAFETIDRDILMQKLFCYGITADEYNWFRSYLNQRYQRTGFNGVLSALREVELGVPQGSVLGPLLFVLYINDIIGSIKYSEINLFADDTLLSIAGENLADCLEKMNEDLASLTKWLKFNKLKLNVSKTKYMIVTRRRVGAASHNALVIDNEPLEEVESIKYLGVQIDNKLTFKKHLELVIKKMAKKIGFLGRISNKLTCRTKTMIYQSIIQPHIDYCSSIIFMANEGEMRSLQLLQNRAMRIILKKRRRTHIKWMLDVLEFHSVKQRVNFNTLILVFKIKNNMVPEYMNDELTYNRDATTRNLRNADDFRLPAYKKTYTQNSMWYDGLKLFNELGPAIKEERNINRFKESVFVWVKQRFPV